MSSQITFHKVTNPEGVVVRVQATVDVAELDKYGIKDMPVVSLSRNGLKCKFDIISMHEHTCWPIHKTLEDAAAYGDRIYKDIKEWCNEHGVDLSGQKAWKD